MTNKRKKYICTKNQAPQGNPKKSETRGEISRADKNFKIKCLLSLERRENCTNKLKIKTNKQTKKRMTQQRTLGN